MNQKLAKKISQKLEKLQELLANLTKAQVIEPDDPETGDADTLYNLTTELKETLELLENEEQGLLTLISAGETGQETTEADD